MNGKQLYLKNNNQNHLLFNGLRIGYVYVVQIGKSQLCKIGCSRNPAIRIRDLGKYYRNWEGKFNIIRIFASTDYEQLEQRLHFFYREKSAPIGFEWFILDQNDLADICNFRLGVAE